MKFKELKVAQRFRPTNNEGTLPDYMCGDFYRMKKVTNPYNDRLLANAVRVKPSLGYGSQGPLYDEFDFVYFNSDDEVELLEELR